MGLFNFSLVFTYNDSLYSVKLSYIRHNKVDDRFDIYNFPSHKRSPIPSPSLLVNLVSSKNPVELLSMWWFSLRITFDTRNRLLIYMYIKVSNIVTMVRPWWYNYQPFRHVYTTVPHKPFIDIEDELKSHLLDFDEIFMSDKFSLFIFIYF